MLFVDVERKVNANKKQSNNILSSKLTQQLFGIYPANISYEGIVSKGKSQYNLYMATYCGDEPSVCPKCGEKLVGHGSRNLLITGTPIGSIPTKIKLCFPRKRCTNEKCRAMWQPTFEGIDIKRKMTKKALHSIIEQSISNTFEEVAHNYPVSNVTISNVFTDFINENKAYFRFQIPEYMGIDEIKINSDFIIVITDLEHRTMYDLIEKRDQRFLEQYFDNLPLKDREKVKWVCSDANQSFQEPLHAFLPNASWAIGRFHVVMKANEAVDTICCEFQNKYPKIIDRHFKHGPMCVLKKRFNDLSWDELQSVRWLGHNPNFLPLAIAYVLKENFLNIYDKYPNSKEHAIHAYQEWETHIPKGAIYEPFRVLSKTVNDFFEEIFAVWDCDIAISNGYTECQNRLVHEAHVKGRGYSFNTLRAKTLLRGVNIEQIIREGGSHLLGPVLEENKTSNLVYYSTAGNDGIDLTAEAYNSFDVSGLS